MSIVESKPRSGRIYTCLVGEIVKADDRPDEAAEVVRERFSAKTPTGKYVYSNRSLGRWLGIAEATAAKHRIEGCACYRDQS